MCSRELVEAVESVVVMLIVRLIMCTLVEAVESVVVEAVDCCRLLCALVLLKLLNVLLNLLIVVGYIMCSRELKFC